MFESLTERLQAVMQDLGRRGKLREGDIEAALREIRLALLDADVHFKVVKDLLDRVRQRALGAQISAGLNPSQEVLRIMHDELAAVLGEPGGLKLDGPKPRLILLVGLQGSGKTTTAAKLAKRLRADGERVMLVAADVQRPAAVAQLEKLGSTISVPVYGAGGSVAADVLAEGLDQASKGGFGTVIADTAGRSQLDSGMMEELVEIRSAHKPSQSILVADAMTGQQAVRIAEGFAETLPLTGLILTKMDGDARGGAAISMRARTGVPILFIGTGESLDALETFQPSRLASRILGMGDVATLVEKAQASVDVASAEQQLGRLQRGEFSLEDFASQLQQVQRMGPLGKVLDLLPANMLGGAVAKVDPTVVEYQLTRTQAILNSMTPGERRDPKVLNGSRKRRIAAGSGTSVQEINQLLHQYRQMKKLFKQMGRGGLGGLIPGLR
ncbi:MAG: signal recognition particle protein [Anaerolineales bacterium]